VPITAQGLLDQFSEAILRGTMMAGELRVREEVAESRKPQTWK
jgi:hypothetical protein